MNKTVLILLLALSYASAFTQWGGSGGYGNYRGYGGYNRGRWSGGYSGGWGNSADFTGDIAGDFDGDYTGGQDDSTGDSDDTASVANGGAYSCSNAIDNVHRAFDQLVEDIRAQANEWIVYADIDSVDEVSYYFASNCDTQEFEVVSQGKNGGSGSQACQGLSKLLKAVVQQETGAFRENYKQIAQLSEQALSLGGGVEGGCQVRVVKKEQEQQQSQRQQSQKSQQSQQQNQEEEIEQEEQIEQPQQQHSAHARQTGQKHGSLADALFKKFAKSNTKSQYGNDIADQYTSKYAGQYANQYNNGKYGNYGNQYGKDYIEQGKNMTRLAGSGEGQKYGEDQSALSHKLNKEYTEKYAKGKENQWKKYQEKYQKNNEEEDNLENEESAFNLDDLFIDLTWM